MSGSAWRSAGGTGVRVRGIFNDGRPVFLREHAHAEDAPDIARPFVAVNEFGDGLMAQEVRRASDRDRGYRPSARPGDSDALSPPRASRSAAV